MSDQLLCLSAETFPQLDHGRGALTMNRAIKTAISDCLDRPADKRPRKVILTLEFVPVMEVYEQSASCEGVKGRYTVKGSMPQYESGALDFGVRANGTVVFNEHSPTNHRQTTLFDSENA
jgi:hypothetical protein